MFELGCFHNGSSDLPVIYNADGLAISDGSLADAHAAAQRTTTGYEWRARTRTGDRSTRGEIRSRSRISITA